jgi:hypothetical protein
MLISAYRHVEALLRIGQTSIALEAATLDLDIANLSISGPAARYPSPPPLRLPRSLSQVNVAPVQWTDRDFDDLKVCGGSQDVESIGSSGRDVAKNAIVDQAATVTEPNACVTPMESIPCQSLDDTYSRYAHPRNDQNQSASSSALQPYRNRRNSPHPPNVQGQGVVYFGPPVDFVAGHDSVPAYGNTGIMQGHPMTFSTGQLASAQRPATLPNLHQRHQQVAMSTGIASKTEKQERRLPCVFHNINDPDKDKFKYCRIRRRYLCNLEYVHYVRPNCPKVTLLIYCQASSRQTQTVLLFHLPQYMGLF